MKDEQVMSIERIKYLEEYLNYKNVNVSKNSDINILISHIGYLAEMIYKLAEMIDNRNPDLDNAIEQANQQVKNIQSLKINTADIEYHGDDVQEYERN